MIHVRNINAMLACAVAVLAGCQEYRIEHRTRPTYYADLSDSPLPDRVEMQDGTVVMYHAKGYNRNESNPKTSEKKQFQAREELDDGTIVLRAILPEHVIANTLECIRNEEYELLWEQLLAEQTKMAYEAKGMTMDDFIAFFREHRIELARSLNRMVFDFTTHQIVVEQNENGVFICRFWPQVAQHFRFKQVAIVQEGYTLKLALIF